MHRWQVGQGASQRLWLRLSWMMDDHHVFGNRASAKLSASNGCKSSSVSPTPTNFTGMPSWSTTDTYMY